MKFLGKRLAVMSRKQVLRSVSKCRQSHKRRATIRTLMAQEWHFGGPGLWGFPTKERYGGRSQQMGTSWR